MISEAIVFPYATHAWKSKDKWLGAARDWPEISEFIKKRRIALDIGAFVGVWSRVLSKEFDRVIAFEPGDDAAECWQKNLDGSGNAELIKTAVMHVNGLIPVLKNKKMGSIQVGTMDPLDERCYEVLDPIRCIKLDSLNLQIVDFIKIDGDGTDPMILSGASETIRRCKPVIYVETKTAKDGVMAMARQLGYRILKEFEKDVLIGAIDEEAEEV